MGKVGGKSGWKRWVGKVGGKNGGKGIREKGGWER